MGHIHRPDPTVAAGSPSPLTLAANDSRALAANDSRELSDGSTEHAPIFLIEPRTLISQCFARTLVDALSLEVHEFRYAEEVIEQNELRAPELMIFFDCANSPVDEIQQCIGLLTRRFPRVPVVIIAEPEEFSRLQPFLSNGISGYIPMGVGLDVAVEALRLVKAGGTYVPLSALMSQAVAPFDRVSEFDSPPPSPVSGKQTLLTERQTAVAAALRRGKANKVIAYELNMKESTVKVHIRNIMQKLNAKNRTEAAIAAAELLGE